LKNLGKLVGHLKAAGGPRDGQHCSKALKQKVCRSERVGMQFLYVKLQILSYVKLLAA